jgi:hypothetical protein
MIGLCLLFIIYIRRDCNNYISKIHIQNYGCLQIIKIKKLLQYFRRRQVVFLL